MNNVEKYSRFFEEQEIAIVFAANDHYVPYLTVAIHSLARNSNIKNKYDIFVFSKDISEKNKTTIKEFIEKQNISVRFVDIKDYFKSALKVVGHITEETYFRLIMPDILKDYNRILYLDADIIILNDIMQLCKIDMKGYPLAATEECMFSGLVNICGDQEKEYFYKKLGLKNLDTYFQAGVLLFDVDYYNNRHLSELLMNRAMTNSYKMMDQDILNEYFNENYIRFGNEWNFTPLQKHMEEMDYIGNMSPNIRKKYLAVKNPKLIHYADKYKPWLYPNENLAYIWWSYARQTPFYEEILLRMIQHNTSMAMQISRNVDLSTIKNVLNLGRNKLKYFRYKLLSKITFGKKRKKYKEKRKKLKTLIKQTKQFFKKY